MQGQNIGHRHESWVQLDPIQTHAQVSTSLTTYLQTVKLDAWVFALKETVDNRAAGGDWSLGGGRNMMLRMCHDRTDDA
jgi:hypothetical protein